MDWSGVVAWLSRTPPSCTPALCGAPLRPPNDPLWYLQWASGPKGVGAPAAWDITTARSSPARPWHRPVSMFRRFRGIFHHHRAPHSVVVPPVVLMLHSLSECNVVMVGEMIHHRHS